MAERTLRGARLGGQSFEDERGIEFAARQQVGYRCSNGHEFEITMSVEADVPAVWECPRCGAEALSTSGILREEKAEKPARTHWDMLLERRSEKELEDILKERLELLRDGEIGPAHLHRANAKQRVRARPERRRRSDESRVRSQRRRTAEYGRRELLAAGPIGPTSSRRRPRPGRRALAARVRGDVRRRAARRPPGSAAAGPPAG